MSFLLRPPGKRKEVMRLNPVDFRFTPLKVDRELEKIIYCKKHADTKPIVFKLGPGWTSDNEGEVRFLVVEGNPMVSYVSSAGVAVVESVSKFLEYVWGEKAYKNLPKDLKLALDERSIGVTVNVEPVIPDLDLQAAFDEIKAESILYEADLENLAKLGEAKETKKPLERIMDKIPWILAGIGVTYILQGMNIIRGF